MRSNLERDDAMTSANLMQDNNKRRITIKKINSTIKEAVGKKNRGNFLFLIKHGFYEQRKHKHKYKRKHTGKAQDDPACTGSFFCV